MLSNYTGSCPSELHQALLWKRRWMSVDGWQSTQNTCSAVSLEPPHPFSEIQTLPGSTGCICAPEVITERNAMFLERTPFNGIPTQPGIPLEVTSQNGFRNTTQRFLNTNTLELRPNPGFNWMCMCSEKASKSSAKVPEFTQVHWTSDPTWHSTGMCFSSESQSQNTQQLFQNARLVYTQRYGV